MAVQTKLNALVLLTNQEKYRDNFFNGQNYTCVH